jgi:uncharacterized protein YybS (DUF2232 family)
MVKDIITGVLITSLIFLIAIFIPIIGFVFALAIPLPILFYRSKLGRKAGAMILIAAAVVMFFFIGAISLDGLFFLELLLIGLVLGELIELKLSIEKTVLYTCGCVFLSALGGLLLCGMLSGQGAAAMVSGYVARNLEMTLGLYRKMGMSEDTIQLISESLDTIHYIFVRIIPALLSATTLLVVWANILLAEPILKNRSLFYPDFGRLNLWKAPDVLVWVVIGCGLALFLPNTTVKLVALNGLIILMTVYFFQGIAIVSFYFEKKRFPRAIRIFLYTLIALQQLILLAVIGLGFFDLWVNFRRLRQPTASA